MKNFTTVLLALAFLSVGVGTHASDLTVKGDIKVNSAEYPFITIGDEGCAGGSYSGITFGNDAPNCWNYSLKGDSIDTFLNRNSGGSIFFREGNVDQMVLKAGGKLGIGTSSPWTTLHVSGVDQSTSVTISNGDSSVSRYPGLAIRNYLGTTQTAGTPHVTMYNYGGTMGSPEPTSMGQTLGVISFNGYNGTAAVAAARILVKTQSNFGTTQSPVEYPADMRFNVGGVGTCCGETRMTIKGENGRVGVGSEDPSQELEVAGQIRMTPGAKDTCDATTAGSIAYEESGGIGTFYGCKSLSTGVYDWVQLNL